MRIKKYIMRIDHWRQTAQIKLEHAGIESHEAHIELCFLIEACLGLSRSQQMIYPDRLVESTSLQKLENYLIRRCNREPLAHLLGEWSFWGLDFKVTPNTLIPRSDTEVLVEEVLAFLESSFYQNLELKTHWLCDVGTGTGCVGLALASEQPTLNYHLLDICPKALDVAQENLTSLRTQQQITAHTQVELFVSDLLDVYRTDQLKIPQIIVSNPPYVKRSVQETLMPEVKDYDPDLALFDEAEDGLDLTRQLVAQAAVLLPRHGAIFIEVGFDQTELTELILEKYGFAQIKTRSDYGGNPRVVSGIKLG